MNKFVEPDDKAIRRKLSVKVYEHLKALLTSGELAPGDTVPSERDLMEQFSVGRPAVREALQALQNKGLITIAHGERTRVNDFTADLAFNQFDDIAKLLLSRDPASVRHLSQIRRIVEIGTAKIAAENCCATDADELDELVEKQRSHMKNPDQFVKVDIEFHTRIAEITRNPIIHATTEMMLTWMHEFHTSLLYWSNYETKTLNEHSNIVAALKTNDSNAAQEAMAEHIRPRKFV